MEENLQAIREKYLEVANEAEERLRRFPYEKLGRAGQILVDNPRSVRPKQQQSLLRQVECSGSDETTYLQSPLIGTVGESD